MSILLAGLAGYQEEIQKSFNSDWINQQWDFFRQARIELTECIGHLGSNTETAWWKKAPLDKDQAVMELVDALVFIQLGLMKSTELSSSYVGGVVLTHITHGHEEQVNHSLIENLPENYIMDFIDDKLVEKYVVNTSGEILTESVMHDLDCAIENCNSVFYDVTLNKIGSTLALLDVSLDQFYMLYIGKGALNEFRQENGYKKGLYVKVWDGKEDNEYLSSYVDKLLTSISTNLNDPLDVKASIKELLGMTYTSFGFDKNTEVQKYGL